MANNMTKYKTPADSILNYKGEGNMKTYRDKDSIIDKALNMLEMKVLGQQETVKEDDMSFYDDIDLLESVIAEVENELGIDNTSSDNTNVDLSALDQPEENKEENQEPAAPTTEDVTVEMALLESNIALIEQELDQIDSTLGGDEDENENNIPDLTGSETGEGGEGTPHEAIPDVTQPATPGEGNENEEDIDAAMEMAMLEAELALLEDPGAEVQLENDAITDTTDIDLALLEMELLEDDLDMIDDDDIKV